jgi:hypothetical protein
MDLPSGTLLMSHAMTPGAAATANKQKVHVHLKLVIVTRVRDPELDPDRLVRITDPNLDPSIIKQK